jgi:hypothetical protein
VTAALLPETDYSPLLRTDFTDDGAWQALVDQIGDDWLTVIADPGHRGLSVRELVAMVPGGSRYPVLVVADAVTFSSAERSLLLIDVSEESGRTFRVRPFPVLGPRVRISGARPSPFAPHDRGGRAYPRNPESSRGPIE